MLFYEGEWVVDLMGEVGFIDEVKTLNRYVVIFPESKTQRTRYTEELEFALVEPLYNDFNIHFLQTLAVNTGDKDWFNNLSKKLGVEK